MKKYLIIGIVTLVLVSAGLFYFTQTNKNLSSDEGAQVQVKTLSIGTQYRMSYPATWEIEKQVSSHITLIGKSPISGNELRLRIGITPSKNYKTEEEYINIANSELSPPGGGFFKVGASEASPFFPSLGIYGKRIDGQVAFLSSFIILPQLPFVSLSLNPRDESKILNVLPELDFFEELISTLRFRPTQEEG